MKTYPKTTAVILFARSAEGEANVKSLLPSGKKNRQLHKGLINKAILAAKQSKGTYIHINEHLQHGDSFGERIANGLQSVFDNGFSHAIIIGGDCPKLGIEEINQAIDSLEHNKFVAGPDQHGGAYLIGLSRRQFRYDSFKNLSWNTSGLFEDLLVYARPFAEFIALSGKFDLNSAEDVLINATSSYSLYQILSAIFSDIFQGFQSPKKLTSFGSQQYKSRRGPPVLM